MKSQITTNRFSQTLIALVLFFIVGAGLFLVGAQNPIQAVTSARTTAAEQDARLVLQELERERIDQLNASSYIAALRERATAARDLQSVQHELERERFEQYYATVFAATERARIAARDLQTVMFELERERFPQVYVRAFDAASFACLDPRVNCDR